MYKIYETLINRIASQINVAMCSKYLCTAAYGCQHRSPKIDFADRAMIAPPFEEVQINLTDFILKSFSVVELYPNHKHCNKI